MPLAAHRSGARPSGFALLFRALRARLLGSCPGYPLSSQCLRAASLQRAERQARLSRIQEEDALLAAAVGREP
jgi:hypothetical protein